MAILCSSASRVGFVAPRFLPALDLRKPRPLPLALQNRLRADTGRVGLWAARGLGLGRLAPYAAPCFERRRCRAAPRAVRAVQRVSASGSAAKHPDSGALVLGGGGALVLDPPSR